MSDIYKKPQTLGDLIEQRYYGENGVYTGWNHDSFEVYKRKQEEARKASSGNTNNKVICTELVRQGLMSRHDLLLGARYFEERLSERHMRGYHLWALSVVRAMRRSPAQTAIWRVLAQARANAIAAHCGGRRATLFERAVLRTFDAGCWTLGWKAPAPDWNVLYETEADANR